MTMEHAEPGDDASSWSHEESDV